MKFIFFIKSFQYKNNNINNLNRCFVSLFLIISLVFTSRAQTKVDSLEQLLKTPLAKNEQLKIEINIVNKLLQSNPKKADSYLNILEKKINSKSSTKFLVQFYYAKSIRHRQKRKLDSARIVIKKALIYANTDKDSLEFKAKLYNSLGAIADDNDNIKEAVKNHLIALDYAKKNANPNMIATVLSGLGRAYLGVPEVEIAKDYYLKAIKIKEENNIFDSSLAIYYNNLSICFDKEKKHEQSLFYLDKSIALKKKSETPFSLISAYNNKAYTLYLLNQYKKAEKTVKKAIKIADSLQIERETIYPYATLSEILIEQGKLKEAEVVMNKSIELSKLYNNLNLAEDNLFMLYRVHYKKGNYKSALEYYEKMIVVKDSIRNKKRRFEEHKLATQYKTNQKNKEIELLSKENKISEIELKKSNQLKITFLITALLSLIVLVLLWLRYKNKAKTDALLAEAMERSFEKKLADSELQSLRAQMNPHFLFNCLNSINSFIIKNEQEQASEYLSKFSKLIRQVLNNSKASRITLANELETLELYIEMESLRFSKKFDYNISVASNVEVDYLEVPPLIIQPYVENSIWHGLMHKTEGKGKLNINITQSIDFITISVEDNGVGRDKAIKLKSKTAIKSKSYGMNITKERLKYINKNNKQLTDIEIIDLKDKKGNALGTKVVLKIGL